MSFKEPINLHQIGRSNSKLTTTAMIAASLSSFPIKDAKRLQQVSVDAQFYVFCTNCGFEERLQRAFKKKRHAPCLQCGERVKRTRVRHLLRDRGNCIDCGTAFDILSGPWMVIRCPYCDSQHLDIKDSSIEPRFPRQFGERDISSSFIMSGAAKTGETAPTDIKTHTWGLDGVIDAQLINAESQMWQNLPGGHNEIYSLMLFANRLRHHSPYADVVEQYAINNIEANLAQAYFKETGSLKTIGSALELFENMINLTSDPVGKSLAQHSFAMAAFSILARFPENYAATMMARPLLRQNAIKVALAAEGAIDNLVREGVHAASSQLARVRWILGDLLRVGNSSEDERRKAISYLNLILTDEKFERRFGFAAREARGSTLASLSDLTENELEQALNDLLMAIKASGSDAAYSLHWLAHYNLSQLVLRFGDSKEALPWYQQAASRAWQQFQALGYEEQVIFQSERYVSVFEGLASLYVASGWTGEALALVEMTRGSSIRIYTMDKSSRRRFMQGNKEKFLESLWPATLRNQGIQPFTGSPSEVHIDDILEKLNIIPDLIDILTTNQEIPTALFTLIEDRGLVTTILCKVVEVTKPANYKKGKQKPNWHWNLQCHQAKLGDEQLAILHGKRHLAAGPFRERLLGKLCQQAFHLLLGPVTEKLSTLGVSRILISLPGALTGLPVEAFGNDSEQPLLPSLGISTVYMPSIRLGADLINHRNRQRVSLLSAQKELRSVLLIGYGGSDLPGTQTEYEGIAAVCGSALTYLPGEKATKRHVLEALRERYDIIHIQAHGSFEPLVPLASALHFVPDLENDQRCIAAFDLLNEVRLEGAPVFILSACSSAITAGWRTGTYQGLLGSLLRVGASGVIGSRWPVADRGAADFMTRLHKVMRNPATLPEQALREVAQHMRREGASRDLWGAFGYFGIS